MISVRFQGKPFNITVIQAYVPNSNAEEAEVEWFYGDLQDLLKLTPKKDGVFIIGDWNAKVRSQETPGVTNKLALVQNEYKMKQSKGEHSFAKKTQWSQKTASFNNTRFYTWTSPDGQH